MGGMYSMVSGSNPVAPYLLEMVGIQPGLCGRYRDCAILPDGDGHLVVILTRNGGGNREDHQEAHEYLAGQPGYLRDYDEAFDETYASYEFSWKKQATPAFKTIGLSEELMPFAEEKLVAEQGFLEKPMERYRRLIESISDPESEEGKAVMERTKPLQRALGQIFAGEAQGVTMVEISEDRVVVDGHQQEA